MIYTTPQYSNQRMESAKGGSLGSIYAGLYTKLPQFLNTRQKLDIVKAVACKGGHTSFHQYLEDHMDAAVELLDS